MVRRRRKKALARPDEAHANDLFKTLAEWNQCLIGTSLGPKGP